MSDATPTEAAGAATPIQIDLELVESWKSVAHVKVEPSMMETMRDKAAAKLAKKIRMDGFRPGKVPVAVVRKQMPGNVEQDALEALVPVAYKQVLDQHEDLHPISDPTVDALEMPEGEPLTFDLVIETRPDLEITGLDAVEATRVMPPITEERIDEALASVRDRHGHWHERGEGEGVEENDAALIDTVPLDAEGKPIEAEGEAGQAVMVGGEGVLPEISNALIGMQIGEETDAEVTYPEDYPNEDLKGTTRTVRLKVNEIRVRHVPELDDEFAKEHSKFETLVEMREDVRKQLTEGILRESDRNLRSQLVESLVKINDIPVPPSLEGRYLDAILSDALRNQPGAEELDDDLKQKLAEAYRPMAQQAVQKMILVDNLRRNLEVTVSDEELDARISELAEEQNSTPERMKAMIESSGNLDRLRGDLEEDKVFAILEDKATITVSEELPEQPPVADAGEA